MLFQETKLKGAYLIDLERREDHRGFFARAWCKNEFEEHYLNANFLQANVGFSLKKGTLRGMHYQIEPYQEVKVVRCTMGAIYDVIIDLRRNSLTYRQWIGVELTSDNRRMIYVPEGFAHGYQTLKDNTEIYYMTSQVYSPEFARGHRYNDPSFRITWPYEVECISDGDRAWPDYV
jgi:dTDP-4-dehydrorhamnose 3,5-epimerase